MNDLDSHIFSFWWTLTKRPAPLIERIGSAEVSLREWQLQRSLYRCPSRTSRLQKAFALFFLNRCNRSGVVRSGGPIGGVKQNGKWRIDARFNKRDLLQRCKTIAFYRQRIGVGNEDGSKFIRRYGRKAFLFIDPPYYGRGRNLYLNELDHSYHESLAKSLEKLKDFPWVLTYDDCQEIRHFYEGWAQVRPFGLRYVAAKRKYGAEVMICPQWMILPTAQESKSVLWD